MKEKKMSTSDIDKTTDAILKKMAELNRLLTSTISPETKKTIGKYMELMVNKVTDTAFDLMKKTLSMEKDLSETRKKLIKEVVSSWITLIKTYEELSFYLSPVTIASIWTMIANTMDLGMKIGAMSATGTIEVREKVRKDLEKKLREIARQKGYVI